MLHAPTDQEIDLIHRIQEYSRSDFIVLRLTKTMLKKSTLDANQGIVRLFREQGLFDYSTAIDGEIYKVKCDILTRSGVLNTVCSCYRPKAKPHKPGDPRFLPYALKKACGEGDLIYAEIKDSTLVVIPVLESIITTEILQYYFGEQESPHAAQVEKIKAIISSIKDVWIESVSKKKKNDKDVGETLEKYLGIDSNSSKKADIDGVLELKSKRKKSQTDYTLFCKVPIPSLTPLKKVKNIILEHGYQSRSPKRPEYTSLYVTVNSKPNNRGFYHKVDRNKEQLAQYRVMGSGEDILVGVWTFDVLKKSLYDKHPATAWVKAEETKIDGTIHFKYNELEITEQPIFEKFLIGLETDRVIFNWRGEQPPKDGEGSVIDYGHAFRLNSNTATSFLFGKSETIQI